MKGLSEYAVQTYHKGKQLLKDYTFSIELGDLYRQVSNYSLMIEEYLNYADEDPTKCSAGAEIKLQKCIK